VLSLRQQVEEAVDHGAWEEMEKLVAENPRTVRYLLGMTYQDDAQRRQHAARAIALAGRYHQKLVQKVIRRLVWAMNDESGTNAQTAPEVLEAIAKEQPELLLPFVPDLTRLAADCGLQAGLARTLRAVTQGCPGEVGERMTRALSESMHRGGCHEPEK